MSLPYGWLPYIKGKFIVTEGVIDGAIKLKDADDEKELGELSLLPQH